MKNSMLFFYYRSGSNFAKSLLEVLTPEEVARADTQKAAGILREPIGILRSTCTPPCPVQHTSGPDLFKVIEEDNAAEVAPYKVWYTYVWNWWGEVDNHSKVPDPYSGETPCRWGIRELSQMPGSDWKFAIQIRDPRNHIESVRKAATEKKAQAMTTSENYFLTLCKGARNRARVVIDCQQQMPNYYIYKFEDLYLTPLETMKTLFAFLGFEPDIESMSSVQEEHKSGQSKDMALFLKGQGRPDKHSSFGSTDGCLNRWRSWAKWEIDAFMDIMGQELIELGYQKELTT